MTRLSVNINKIATIRNARGGNMPDVTKAAVDCEKFGAEGITVHPRPDERHIRYADVREIRPLITTEFNIEGNPTVQSFVDLVLEVVPDQVTLVPDGHNAITSNAGWNTVKNRDLLTDLCKTFHSKGIRTSIFIDPDPLMAEGAALCGADRVELYTADYAAGRVPPGPRNCHRPVSGNRQSRPDSRSGPERRTRPLAGEPGLFHRDHSLDRRSLHRPCAHLRRPVSGPGENYSGLSFANPQKIIIFAFRTNNIKQNQ